VELTFKRKIDMKLVVKEINSFPRVGINECSDDKFYGCCLISVEKTKSFIVKDKFRGGTYVAMTIDGTTKGDYYLFPPQDTLLKTLESMNDHFDIYEFDTAKELFKWLSE